MKHNNRFILALSATAALISCENPDITPDETPSNGSILILNNGNWGGNDASISIYDPTTSNITGNAFLKANGINPGDLAQDILPDGNDIYIAVYGSQTIFVTDCNLKIKKQITAYADGTRLSPRHLAKGEDKIYVTYYEGYLGEIDPESDYGVRTTPVGKNPEGVVYAGGKIYTANSGGMNHPDYDNTVSVVDAATFGQSEMFEVNTNPSQITADSKGNTLYITSFGNYADISAKLQAYDIASGTLSDTPYMNVSGISSGNDDRLYILCAGYDENWNPLPGRVYIHDAARNLPFGRSDSEPVPFVSDNTVFPDAYSISATADGYVYIGCSDYVNTGDIYVMTPEGTLHDTFDSCGLNPIKTVLYGI